MEKKLFLKKLVLVGEGSDGAHCPPPPLPFPTALIKSVFASSYTERKQVQKSF